MVRVVSFLSSEITHLWKVWTAYNPERHYMRGPGPKWREKHASLRIADGGASPHADRRLGHGCFIALTAPVGKKGPADNAA